MLTKNVSNNQIHKQMQQTKKQMWSRIFLHCNQRHSLHLNSLDWDEYFQILRFLLKKQTNMQTYVPRCPYYSTFPDAFFLVDKEATIESELILLWNPCFSWLIFAISIYLFLFDFAHWLLKVRSHFHRMDGYTFWWPAVNSWTAYSHPHKNNRK